MLDDGFFGEWEEPFLVTMLFVMDIHCKNLGFCII